MTTVPPSTVADSTITSIPRNSSVSAAEFQPLVVGHPPNEVRLHEPWQTQNTDKVHISVSDAVSFIAASASTCSALPSTSNFLKLAASAFNTLKLTLFCFRFHCFEISPFSLLI